MTHLDHINILATDLVAVRDFLLAALPDLEDGFRPPFDFAGYWLYLDGRPVIHLKGRDPGAGQGGGWVDHLAFAPFDFDAEQARLTRLGLSFTTGSIPDTGIRQIFVGGPEGLKLELQCPPSR
jgi:catechol 2,3-dioxygenase-like lactoylglutathione lyase family enzyme